MDSKRIKYFAAVVKHSSITKAAAELNISQPALTKSIKLLQEELGVELFVRKGRGIVPSRFGNVLAEHARSIAVETEKAKERIAQLRDSATERVTIGASPSVMNDIVAAAVTEVLSQRKDITISIKEGLAEDLYDSLLRGDIDLMVCGLHSFLVSPTTTSEVLFTDELTAATRPNHPLTRKKKISLADTIDYGWVLPQANRSARILLQDTFLTAGLRLPRVVVESDSSTFTHALVNRTDYILIVSETAMDHMPTPQITSLKLPEMSWRRHVGMAYWAHGTKTELLLEVMDKLRSLAASYKSSAPRQDRT